MAKKLFAMVAMLGLVLMATLANPQKVRACSGNDCGCDTIQAQCDAACPPEGDPNRPACITLCAKQYTCCAINCCGGCCPPHPFGCGD